jgi:hypothetical protein
MLIQKLFYIGYTPRGGVEAAAPARPDPHGRALGRNPATGAVRKAGVRRQAESRNAGVRSVVIEA